MEKVKHFLIGGSSKILLRQWNDTWGVCAVLAVLYRPLLRHEFEAKSLNADLQGPLIGCQKMACGAVFDHVKRQISAGVGLSFQMR